MTLFMPPPVLGLILLGVINNFAAAVPPVPVPVLLVAGQSNATGLASQIELQQPELRAPQRNVLFYCNSTLWTPGSVPGAEKWAAAHPPLWGPMQLPTEPETLPRGNDTDVKGIFGPEFTLGRTYAGYIGQPVAVIKSTWPGSNLAVQWNPEAASGPMYYAKMKMNVVHGLADLKKQAGLEGKLAGFIWSQGEGDANDFAASYADNLRKLISHVRTDLGDPNLPFIIAETSSQESAVVSAGRIPLIRAAQEEAARMTPRTFVVETSDLPLRPNDPKVDPIPIHFNTAGQLALGERLAWALAAVEGRPARSVIPGLANTGMREPITLANANAASNRLDEGDADARWRAGRGDEAGAACKVIAAHATGGWINDATADPISPFTRYPNSRWITSSADTRGATDYSIRFRLDGLFSASAVITGQFAAPEGTRLFLNGRDLQIQSLCELRNWTPFSLRAGAGPAAAVLLPAENVLTFRLPRSKDGTPLPIRVEFLNTTAMSAKKPATTQPR